MNVLFQEVFYFGFSDPRKVCVNQTQKQNTNYEGSPACPHLVFGRPLWNLRSSDTLDAALLSICKTEPTHRHKHTQ